MSVVRTAKRAARKAVSWWPRTKRPKAWFNISTNADELKLGRVATREEAGAAIDASLAEFAVDRPLIHFADVGGSTIRIATIDEGIADLVALIVQTLQPLSSRVRSFRVNWRPTYVTDVQSLATYADKVGIIKIVADLSDGKFTYSIEKWHSDEDGRINAPRNNSLISRIWSQDLVSSGPAVVGMNDILPSPPLTQVDFPIDVVYTWVNGQDPEWQELFSKYNPQVESDANDRARFENRDDLKYSLRSISEFAPWVRNIYVVSNCKPPTWLDLDRDDIHWVQHEELFDPEFLPTFSSHAIETVLHKIPGLAEHFLYLNDDFYLVRDVYPEHFFFSNGIAKLRLESYGMVNGEPKLGDPDYLNGARNAAKLISREFGKWPVSLHTHSPQSLNSHILQEMEDKYPAEFNRTRSQRFRSLSDLQVTGFFYSHYAYAIGAAVPSRSNTLLIQQNHNFANRFARIERMREHPKPNSGVFSICINDGNGSAENEEWNNAAFEFLNRYFSTPSRYER